MPIGSGPPLKSTPFSRSVKLGPALGGAKPPPPPKPPSGVRIEHRVGIQAPADVIWELIADLDGWKDWNPLYERASGKISIGGPLETVIVLPGRAPRTIQSTVMEWVPNEQLHWKTRTMGGLVRSIRYIEIEALGEASCIVANGEIVGGLLGPSQVKPIGRSLYRGFIAMNEALKARAEAIWAQRKG